MAFKKYIGYRMKSPLTQSDPFSGKKKDGGEKKLEYQYRPLEQSIQPLPQPIRPHVRMNEHRIHKIKDTSDPFAGTRTKEVYIHPSEYLYNPSRNWDTGFAPKSRTGMLLPTEMVKTKKKHTDWR